VAAIDPAETAYVALELGAEIISTPSEADGLRAWIGAGDDVVLAASGSLQAIPIAGAVVASGGRIVCCGYKPGS
jgi:D-arabinose 1-dehydrogenase-like Zn-dependent alcohol dehydrogenase